MGVTDEMGEIPVELVLHGSPEWGMGIGQWTGNFGGIDQELRSE